VQRKESNATIHYTENGPEREIILYMTKSRARIINTVSDHQLLSTVVQLKPTR
jgi:hypothetical protein